MLCEHMHISALAELTQNVQTENVSRVSLQQAVAQQLAKQQTGVLGCFESYLWLRWTRFASGLVCLLDLFIRCILTLSSASLSSQKGYQEDFGSFACDKHQEA